MIEIRVAESDADLELWRQVRLAVLPYELCPPVDELRRTAEPGKLFLVAELDGVLAGSGLAGQSDLGGASVAPRVLPEARRRGVGTALLRALADHASQLGYDRASANCDDPGSFAFAERFGFRETGRQIEQVRNVGEGEPMPESPAGIELVPLAERDDLFRRVYEELAVEVLRDVPTPTPLQVTADDWERRWLPWRDASFVAMADGEIVGCAGLIEDRDQPDRAEHALTAVRRDWRRRGVAKALKQATIAWASAHGVRELYTWTQTGNEAMQALNRSLGYVDRHAAVTVARDLPLA
ncbi:MAG TPA: GNAT family N-acetyltransferase [Gaiellaceae bacterium]|nr:GNAT family N-acetyltransferase [Gaiellaceae bacterium]